MSCEARFRELFGQHYTAVARYVLGRGFQAADADDLIAATFEVAWRRINAVPGGEDAVPWLLATARNLARNAQRRTLRERSLLGLLARTSVPWNESGSEARAEWDDVRHALGRLRPADRELVLLVAWDGLSPADAGRVLGLRPVAARSRLHRARGRLAALLDEQNGPAPRPTANDAPRAPDTGMMR